MSKDDFPPSLSPHDVLENMFEFFQSWKSKLYDMISFNSLPPSVALEVKPPHISIKQEPVEEESSFLSSSVPRQSDPDVGVLRYSSYGGRSLLQETKEILAQAESSCSRSVSPPLEKKKKKRERSRSSSVGKDSRGHAPVKSFKEEKFPCSEETVRRSRAGGHLSKGKYHSNFLSKKFKF